MNKIQAIQRSKLNTSYGGVGSTIDTIENLSYIVDPFNEWYIYKKLANTRHRRDVYPRLIHKEDRLQERVKKLGFGNLREFFLTEAFEGENIKEWNPNPESIKRMVSSHYFPRMFYCSNPKCHKLHKINDWKNEWKLGDWDKRVPKCHYCSQKKGTKVFAPNLIQVRFVLASMETGDLRDLPWGQIYAKKGTNDGCPSVWDFTLKPTIAERNVTFNIRKGGSDLIDINIKSDNGVIVTMAEIMNHYFIMDLNGKKVAYRPVIRSANNVYFSYVVSSVYIPKYVPTQQEIDDIKYKVDNYTASAKQIAGERGCHLSAAEIQAIIDNNFTVPFPDYSTEEMFRLDEFDCLTNDANYKDGVFADDEDRLLVEKYMWTSPSISCIKQLYLFKRLNVTSAQVAYSRIDKISPSCLANWKGKSDNPKYWYDVNSNSINQDVEVALHPTCEDISTVERMPVVSSYGEGFFVELDKSEMPKEENEKAVFLHTLSHLVMKSLEFYCGYPISSMNERLYILPQKITKADDDKYGFMIYSANGEAGSYGGITSLFETGKIETIIRQAFESAEDCPNDPICESEGGSCFACVHIPETACELFNSKLNRNVVINYWTDKKEVMETDKSVDSTTILVSECSYRAADKIDDNQRHNSKTTNITTSNNPSQPNIADDDDILA